MANCRGCDVLLTNDNWAPSRQAKKHYACKKCCGEYHKIYRSGNLEKIREHKRKWARERHKITPLKSRVAKLKCKYGLILADYDKISENQNGVCATCGGINENGRRLAVDHNHKTNRVRGLLCSNCNMALGNIKDNINTLSKMIVYLNRR